MLGHAPSRAVSPEVSVRLLGSGGPRHLIGILSAFPSGPDAVRTLIARDPIVTPRARPRPDEPSPGRVRPRIELIWVREPLPPHLRGRARSRVPPTSLLHRYRRDRSDSLHRRRCPCVLANPALRVLGGASATRSPGGRDTPLERRASCGEDVLPGRRSRRALCSRSGTGCLRKRAKARPSGTPRLLALVPRDARSGRSDGVPRAAGRLLHDRALSHDAVVIRDALRVVRASTPTSSPSPRDARSSRVQRQQSGALCGRTPRCAGRPGLRSVTGCIRPLRRVRRGEERAFAALAAVSSPPTRAVELRAELDGAAPGLAVAAPQEFFTAGLTTGEVRCSRVLSVRFPSMRRRSTCGRARRVGGRRVKAVVPRPLELCTRSPR